ncbi:MAG TPA: hypothetical protein PKI03_16085 [Pseudomonadota bacterium]|nr:hypothetical protein [Pseudomonadota bacterium]
MTTANKILTGFVASVIALGGAFGGGYYIDMKQRRLVEAQLDEAQKKAKTSEEQLTKDLVRARGRNQLVEAALAEIYQNHGMAFDRTVRTQSLAVRLGLNIQAELDEIRGLIMEQKPESVGRLLHLADKFEPVVGLTLPNTPPPAPPGKAPAPAPAAAPTAAAPPAPAAAPAAPSNPSALVGPAGAVPKAPPSLAPPAPPADLEPVREALRQAKELLLVGGDMSEVARKLARAQVLLNEAGNTSLDNDLTAGIKATRVRDDSKARASVDAALSALRNP